MPPTSCTCCHPQRCPLRLGNSPSNTNLGHEDHSKKGSHFPHLPFLTRISHQCLWPVVSHRWLLVRWDVVRLPGITDTNLLGYKDVQSPVCPNSFHIKQQGAAISLQGGLPFSHQSVASHLLPFSLSLSCNPTGPRGCLWLQDLAGSLGSQTATSTTPTRDLQGVVAQQPQDGGFPTGAAPVCTQTSLGVVNRVTA